VSNPSADDASTRVREFRERLSVMRLSLDLSHYVVRDHKPNPERTNVFRDPDPEAYADLWPFWRHEFSWAAPPPEPPPVRTEEEAHMVLDAFLRRLEEISGPQTGPRMLWGRQEDEPPRPVTADDEAAFWPVKKILDTNGLAFSRSQLRRILKANSKIRRRNPLSKSGKPQKYRLEVHIGELYVVLAQQQRTTLTQEELFDRLDAAYEGVERRKDEEQRRKTRK
jgi:hypothetical protein